MRALLISIVAVVLFIVTQNGLAYVFFNVIEDFMPNAFLFVVRFSESLSYIIVLLITIYFYRKNRKYFKFFGERNTIFDFLSIALVIIVVYFINKSVGDYIWYGVLNEAPIDPSENASMSIKLLIIISVVFLSPLIEELLFRGMILPNLLYRYGEFKSVVLTSILYMLAHIDLIGFNYYNQISVFIMGILYGILLLKYGVFYSILAHVTYNSLWYMTKYLSARPLSLSNWMKYNYEYIGVIGIITLMVLLFAVKVLQKKNNLQLVNN
ncbi:CPBP family intramembrane metalloprotease [Puteibacter caeruleilacunae]|nr:CPBP family intramembrane metalloprotease [Puteibacter caeruleilacunae]